MNGSSAPDSQPQSLVRAFIAVLISDDLKRRIALVQEEFKKVAPEVKWVSEENFHITLKFLGDVEADRLAAIPAMLSDSLADVEEFDIGIGGVGAFPNHGRPRTVWVGVTDGRERLAEVAQQVEEQLAGLGFHKEDRSFSAHLTIGRVKDGRGADALTSALQKADVGSMGTVRVKSVAVMKSELRREGPIYSVLSEIPLRSAGGETKNG